MQLVNALVDQIEGTIEMEREAGTKFIIRFRDELQGNNRRLMSEV
ncbi:hypothetical protein ACSAZK_17760 [Methanosarcina sp. Mfa9]